MLESAATAPAAIVFFKRDIVKSLSSGIELSGRRPRVGWFASGGRFTNPVRTLDVTLPDGKYQGKGSRAEIAQIDEVRRN